MLEDNFGRGPSGPPRPDYIPETVTFFESSEHREQLLNNLATLLETARNPADQDEFQRAIEGMRDALYLARMTYPVSVKKTLTVKSESPTDGNN